MLFNSYAFLLGFLPLALACFHVLLRLELRQMALIALALLSLGFYGWWNPIYLLLLVPLIAVNFALCKAVVPRAEVGPRARKALLVTGIVLNLGVLAWFKYASFAVREANALLGTAIHLAPIVLPLGISFFVFQKIAALVDAHRGKVEEVKLVEYSLFVTFFPQLIAGPIAYLREVLPQLQKRLVPAIPMGLTILAIGLAKKVLLADNIGPFASRRFDAAALGQALSPADAWAGALAYAAQLYFDFSGYCDMAIGAGLLFGIRLPINFNSPYKSESIIDFWRRWHITLSRFLREYLYIPLGGSRRGPVRHYVNLFLTMLLGGFWHGAGWTFLLWGALHGAYLAINHVWRALAGRLNLHLERSIAGRAFAWAVTLVAVLVGWVFFRAADATAALRMLSSMAGLSSSAPSNLPDTQQALMLAGGLLALARFAPNTQELTGYPGPSDAEPVAAAGRWRWRVSPAWAVAVGAALAISLMSLSQVSEFLYFQF